MANIIRPPCDEGAIRGGSVSEPCPERVGIWILVATILGSSMAFIDGTVVNVALPALQKSLGATAVDAQWVVEAYALLLAALILVGGSLGDHYGRKRVFRFGVALFGGASILCGLAQDPGQLIAARALQGVAGALMVPGSLAIISAYFEEGRRGRAIGTWSAFTGITTALGPVLGGYLIESFSWRWVFFINVPIAAAVVVITTTHVPESKDESARRLDYWGAVLATLGLSGVVYGLIESSSRGLGDPVVIASLVAGALALGAFVVVEARSPEPMLPLTLFRSRDFTGANLFTLLLYFALAGALYYFPFLLIQVQGYSATAAGAAFVPAILMMFFLSRYTGGLVDRFGARLPLVLGPLVVAVGFTLFALPGIGGDYVTTYLPAVIVLGLGLAILVPAVTTVAMNSVDPMHAGLASGVNNATARTAALLAIAVFGVLMFSTFSSNLEERLDDLELSAAARAQMEAQEVELAAAEVPRNLDPATVARIETGISESFLAGFRIVMVIAAGLAVVSAISAAVLIEGRPRYAAEPQPAT